MRFIAFDTETADAMGHICSAGISIIEDGRIKESYYYLINPDSDFDAMNIYIHGIRPEDVEDKASFPAVWAELRPVMESGIIVAHNAPFDMGVLSKTLRRYDLEYESEMQYICTCSMSRKLLPKLPNHRLDTLAEYYGIKFDHHNAGGDAYACGMALIRLAEEGAKPEDFIKRYDMESSKTISEKKTEKKRRLP